MTEEQFVIKMNREDNSVWLYDTLENRTFLARTFPPITDIETIMSYRASLIRICDLLNNQQVIIEQQEFRLKQLEELLELSENLNEKYREKLIDSNLKNLFLKRCDDD